jgi:hypothetical protein
MVNIVSPALIKATVQGLFTAPEPTPMTLSAVTTPSVVVTSAGAAITSPAKSATDDLGTGGIPCVN